MNNSLKIGDKVKTLVDKTENSLEGKTFCPKGTIARICHVGDGFVVIEANNQRGDEDTFDFAFSEVELVK